MMKNFSTSSFVAGFMLGILFAGIWLIKDEASQTLLSSLSSVDATESLPESGAISVANQASGIEVAIESVTVPPPGVWVAVREVSGKDLGNVLGAIRVNGPRSAFSVPLLRATEPGLPYAVELYRDDGDGVFDLSMDSVYVDFATGVPVVDHFTTTN